MNNLTSAQPAPAAVPPVSIREWFDGRKALRTSFLERHAWHEAEMTPIGDDSAFRRYFRLRKGDYAIVLMEAVPDNESFATPGHSLRDFGRIGAYLRAIGVNAPHLYAVDEANGYMLLDNFGDTSFKIAAGQGADKNELYGLAVDVLRHLRQNAAPGAIALPDYYASHVHTGRRRIVDWYMPALRGVQNQDGIADSYLAVWNEVEAALPSCSRGFLHIDYHFENLMWLPENEGLSRVGVLDFQGAMIGPLPYDLANLLEDVRVDVPEDLRWMMLARYCDGMTGPEMEAFENWYRVLATQFHCRIAGQFIRLAVRDGKDRYLQHLPRVARYLREGLEHPVLKPLKEWFGVHGVSFTAVPAVDISRLSRLIRPDAF
jgi:aminoglycoside/choline kinase family phosphotransferase